jgi:hypothetical protein
VRAGLGIVEAMAQLNTRLERERGVRLGVRLGCHTGLVVVGEVGGGTRQEQLALGETPNVAARLQGIAAPNTVVISAGSYQLLGGFFACQSLGTPLLKGFAQPIEVYQVRYESTARTRLEAAGSTGLTPLVGREQEVGLLRERWASSARSPRRRSSANWKDFWYSMACRWRRPCRCLPPCSPCRWAPTMPPWPYRPSSRSSRRCTPC